MLAVGAASYSRFSTNLAEALVKLHKAGGLSLVFLFVGISLVLFANLAGAFQVVTLVLGIFLLSCSFAIFAFLHLKGPVRAIRTLRENQSTIDSLQELGLELTGVAHTTQAFALRYSKELADVVDIAMPILLLIPGVGGKVKELKLDRVQHLTRTVLSATAEAEDVIRDTEQALRSADFSVLRQYSGKLRDARTRLRELIADLNEDGKVAIDPRSTGA